MERMAAQNKGPFLCAEIKRLLLTIVVENVPGSVDTYSVNTTMV